MKKKLLKGVVIIALGVIVIISTLLGWYTFKYILDNRYIAVRLGLTPASDRSSIDQAVLQHFTLDISREQAITVAQHLDSDFTQAENIDPYPSCSSVRHVCCEVWRLFIQRGRNIAPYYLCFNDDHKLVSVERFVW